MVHFTALFQSLIDATTATRTEETTAMEKSVQEWRKNPYLQSERNLEEKVEEILQVPGVSHSAGLMWRCRRQV